MIDGDVSTPMVSTMLQDDGDSIVLTVPWTGIDEVYSRWFAQGVMFGDDPNRTKHRYEPPEILWFQDDVGTVTLVGCRSRGSRSNFTHGQGRVAVRFAVAGGQRCPDYRRINGLRSDLPGLGDWMSLRSLTARTVNDADGRLESLHLDLKAPPAVPLLRALNLRIRPNFSFNLPSTPDDALIRESLQIETLAGRPREWSEHLRAHETVRELLAIAGWRAFGYSAQWAHRASDPQRVLTGKAVGERWARVYSYAVLRHQEEKSRPSFLFRFDDIKPAGVRRWFKLREHFSRGVDPIMSTLGGGAGTIEGTMAQVGIGLDAIGYQLALDAGVTQTKANAERHEARLQRVAAEIALALPFKASTWAANAAAVNNGIKHANRPMPDALLTANTLRESRLIFRLWVATRIGAPTASLQQRLTVDPMIYPYELV